MLDAPAREGNPDNVPSRWSEQYQEDSWGRQFKISYGKGFQMAAVLSPNVAQKHLRQQMPIPQPHQTPGFLLAQASGAGPMVAEEPCKAA